MFTCSVNAVFKFSNRMPLIPMTVYTATRTYVGRSSLRSCYSQPLLLYVPRCGIADTCERCLHTATVTRQRPHGGGASEWHSFQSMRGCTRGVRPIKANYLKIVTIRTLHVYIVTQCNNTPGEGKWHHRA